MSNQNSHVNSDSKSTGNNSQGSNEKNSSKDKITTSRTHESFFPKIKNSFEMEEETPYNYINKKFNSNNMILNVDPNYKKASYPNFTNLYDYDSPQLDDLILPCIRMEEGISLRLIRNTNDKKGKKFLHVPDFQIYFIKEILIKDRYFISDYKEKIKHWNKTIEGSDKFVKIYNEYVNNPEGY